MSDPYIPPEDRIDVIGRLNKRLEDSSEASLRERAQEAAADFVSGELTPLKPEMDPKEVKEFKETHKDDPKDDKEEKETSKDEKEAKEDK